MFGLFNINYVLSHDKIPKREEYISEELQDKDIFSINLQFATDHHKNLLRK